MTVIDPAMIFDVYASKITDNVVMPYYKEKGYEVEKLKNFCQQSSDDVYCQTWTLITLIEELNEGAHDFLKDTTLEERKKFLVEFFKAIILVPNICQRLKEIYKKNVSNNIIYPFLIEINPCEYVEKYFSINDL